MATTPFSVCKEFCAGTGGGSSIVVDTEVDAFSDNPVANSAITRYVENNYANNISVMAFETGDRTAKRAECDNNGNIIHTTYATKEALTNGSFLVAEAEVAQKAYNDINGDLIEVSKLATKEELKNVGGGNITVDNELNSESTNPVQNKVIANKLNSQKYYGDMNIVPTDSSLFEFDGFGESNLSVEIYGFSETNDIEELVIPYEYTKDETTYNVSLIVPNAFENNTLLTTVVIPSSVDVIADWAFKGCTNLEKTVFSKGIKDIWAETFGNCTKLKSITLPNTIKVIQERAFDGSGLTDVYYEGTKEQWDLISISEDNETLLNANIHYKWVATDTYATKEELVTQIGDALEGDY